VSSFQVQQVTGLPASTVHRTFGKLEAVGVVRRIRSTASDRVQRYERLPHPFWHAARRLAADAKQGEHDVDKRQR
jgi:predicted transcriptional regulator